MKILIAEDDIDAAESLADIFENDGHLVLIVPNGEEAVEQVQQESFDLIFMDLKMPGMGGYEAIRRIKAVLPELNIIVVTGNTVEAELEQVKMMSGIEVVRKPFNPESLIAMMRNAGKPN